MAIDPRQYADIYPAFRAILQPGIRRTGADLEDPEAATYAVSVTTYDSVTGQPGPMEVVGINRVGALVQIETWRQEIIGLEAKIANTQLFLADADVAPLAEIKT